MKLTIFEDQDGNREYRTKAGTVIPIETINLWEQIVANAKKTGDESRKLQLYIEQCIAAAKNK